MGILIVIIVLLLILVIYLTNDRKCDSASPSTSHDTPVLSNHDRRYKKIEPQAYKNFRDEVMKFVKLYDDDNIMDEFADFFVQGYETVFEGEDSDPLSFEYLTFCTMLTSLIIPVSMPDDIKFAPQIKNNVFATFDFCFYMHMAIIELFSSNLTNSDENMARDYSNLYIDFLRKYAIKRLGISQNDVEELILDRYNSYQFALDLHMRSYDNIDECAVFAAREYLKMFLYKDFCQSPISIDISFESIDHESSMPFFEVLVLEKIVLNMLKEESETLVRAYERQFNLSELDE